MQEKQVSRQARAFLEEALAADPRNVEALRIDRSQLRGGEEPCCGDCKDSQCRLAGCPHSAPIQFLLGEWLEQARDVQGARAAYAAALKADP